MKFILLFILFPLLLSLVSLVFLLTGTYINIDIISSYIAWTIVPTITVFLSYKIATLLFKKSRAALITFILTVIYTILTVVYIMPAFKNASMKAKQMEASTTLSSLIKSSGAYVKEYGKLPVSTKDLGEYMNIYGCTKNNSKFCKTEIPPIDYSNIHRTMWFSPTGNYKYEIKK